MSTQGILLELLMAGVFAVACFRARGKSLDTAGLRFQDFFRLKDRLERLRLSRWQWCSMVFLLLVLRQLSGLSLVAELIVPVQLAIFLALPTAKTEGATL